jgi:hypothetical protein
MTLDNGDFYIIDGRPGGTGTDKYLEISTTSQAAITITNDASNNQLRYCIVKGNSTGTTSGVINIGGSIATGNDDNIINNCDVSGHTSTARILIRITGTSNMQNDKFVISDCNLFDFYNSNVDAYGIYIDNYTKSVKILGNSFYQTVPRGTSAVCPIYIFQLNTTNDTTTISGNYIGGTAPGCGGTKWIHGGRSEKGLQAMYLARNGATSVVSVQGNTIAEIEFSTGSTNSAGGFVGIGCGGSGTFNIGTEVGNIIGSATDTASIKIRNMSSDPVIAHFAAIQGGGSGGLLNVANNIIGGIMSVATSVNGCNIYGVRGTSPGTNNIITTG